jgi:hypothetical protein
LDVVDIIVREKNMMKNERNEMMRKRENIDDKWIFE